MNYILIIILIILTSATLSTKFNHEHFDGIGKSFSIYYPPQKCCKEDDCYPGMYVKNW